MAKKEKTIREKQIESYWQKQKGSTAVYQPFYDNDGNKKVGIVDQFDGQKFNLNPAGHIMSELTALVRANSEAEYNQILARLKEFDAPGSPYSGMNDEEMIKRVKPRYCQSPAEYAKFLDYIQGVDIDMYNRLQSSDQDSPGEPEPDPAVESTPTT